MPSSAAKPRDRHQIKLSVVMPTLNEEPSIAKVIGDIKKNTEGLAVEILIVDSSTDRTPEIAESLGAVVVRQPKRGPGKALIAALLASTGDVVITSDCDDTYPMEQIPDFLSAWEAGADFVNGNRLHGGHDAMPAFNRFGNWSFAVLVRMLHGIPTNDVTTGMRLFTRDLIQSTPWETNLAFWAEIMIRAKEKGFSFHELDINYRLRLGEGTLNPLKSGIAFYKTIIGYRLGLKFDPETL